MSNKTNAPGTQQTRVSDCVYDLDGELVRAIV